MILNSVKSAYSLWFQQRSRPNFQPPPLTPEPHPSVSVTEAADEFVATFNVKSLGSGLVQHYTDFGGCQQLLERVARKSRKTKEEYIITLTAHHLYLSNKTTGKLEQIRKLENVYVVHTDPTNPRLFGYISDNWESGTLHCFCFQTTGKKKDNIHGRDVFQAFREACYHWLMLRKLKQGQQCTWQENSAEDERRDEIPQSDSFSSFLSVSSDEGLEEAQANEEESEGGSQLQVGNQCGINPATPNTARQISTPMLKSHQNKEILFIPLKRAAKGFGSLKRTASEIMRSVHCRRGPILPPRSHPPPPPPPPHQSPPTPPPRTSSLLRSYELGMLDWPY